MRFRRRSLPIHLTLAFSLSLALLASACGTRPASDTPDDALDDVYPPPDANQLSATDHLIRAGMALKGTRPTLEELRAVSDDPQQLPVIVSGWLDSEEFGATVRDLADEALLVRSTVRPDLFQFSAHGSLAGTEEFALNRSLHESALRLVSHVVLEDRPFTEIVTASYAMADRNVAAIFGLAYDGDGTEWKETTWPDGRPAAGILSDTVLFIRHKSTDSNANRGRANAVSKALLCYDFTSRDVVVDGSVDLSDPDAVNDAVVSNASCASCHQTLDPLASFFYGHASFVLPGGITQYPTQLYNPGAEQTWEQSTGRHPGFFGKPGDDLADLGAMIADDPRFSLCAAKRFYAWFNGTELEDVPFEAAASLQKTFVDSGYSGKALAKAVVLRGDFRAYKGGDDVVGLKKARPRQVARMIEDLTGYRWRSYLGFSPTGSAGVAGTVDLVEDSFFGFESLGGGIDSYYATQPARTVNATSSLMLRTLSALAAGHVVDHDSTPGETPRLLTAIDVGDTTESAVRAQLADLHFRVLGEDVGPDSPEVDESYALWKETAQRTLDVRRAWKAVVASMFQDLRVTYY